MSFLFIENYFSCGKLLLTSEYVVLDGALALAIPTQLGQKMQVEEIKDQQSKIYWQSIFPNEKKYNFIIDYTNWKIIESNTKNNESFILRCLQEVWKKSALLSLKNSSYRIKTTIEFPRNFGLGSSSTLINNLAEWSLVDAYSLNERILKGSGYDIAVAKTKSTILYNLSGDFRSVKQINFRPDFRKNLLFIHLNQKQNSREGISLYHSKYKNLEIIEEFSQITQAIINTEKLPEFSNLMNLHEKKLSEFLGIPTVKNKLFPDCPVFIKSLGAWGGDFILTQRFDGADKYFYSKGYTTIIPWENMVKE